MVGGGEQWENIGSEHWGSGVGDGGQDLIGSSTGANNGGRTGAEINGELGDGGEGCNKAGRWVSLCLLVSGVGYGCGEGASFGRVVFGFKGELI